MDKIKVIYKRRSLHDKKAWERYILEINGEDSKKKMAEYNFSTQAEAELFRVEKCAVIKPLDTQLYLLDYLRVDFPARMMPTVQMIKDAIPKEIKGKVYAIEYYRDFVDEIGPFAFFEEDERGIWVSVIALLTTEDTGRALPGTKFELDRPPIGISDEDYAHLCRSFPEYITDIRKEKT